jgi:hypothetical protein
MIATDATNPRPVADCTEHDALGRTVPHGT